MILKMKIETWDLLVCYVDEVAYNSLLVLDKVRNKCKN